MYFLAFHYILQECLKLVHQIQDVSAFLFHEWLSGGVKMSVAESVKGQIIRYLEEIEKLHPTFFNLCDSLLLHIHQA